LSSVKEFGPAQLSNLPIEARGLAFDQVKTFQRVSTITDSVTGREKAIEL
jgi:hypothetical protein